MYSRRRKCSRKLLCARHGTGSHFVTQRTSNPGIQRPGDPVDPVTLFYNELQMSTYVVEKTFVMGKRVASFYRFLAFARSRKVKFWRSHIKCQYFNDRWTDFHKKYISLYLYLGLFFENRKNSGLTSSQNDDPVTPTWKMTQMTHWPSDPMTQFHVWCVHAITLQRLTRRTSPTTRTRT